MDSSKLELISTLRDYCNNNNIYFIPGPESYQNAVMDYNVYKNFDLILVCDLSFSPQFSDNDLDSVQYNGTIALGRKREYTEDDSNSKTYTVSSLDETFEQKYDNRLKELSSLLTEIFLELKCEYDADFTSIRMSYALNQYDLNADFISAEITINI